MRNVWLRLVVAGACIAGCVRIPQGPSVMVLPGSDKSLEQFQADDASCRGWAAQQSATSDRSARDSAQPRYDIAYMQCMYAQGNKVPIPADAELRSATDVPAAGIDRPAGIPPPPAGEPPPPPPNAR